jgi:hypothetical protein
MNGGAIAKSHMIFEYPLIHFGNSEEKIIVKCPCPGCESEKAVKVVGVTRENKALDILEHVLHEKMNRR